MSFESDVAAIASRSLWLRARDVTGSTGTEISWWVDYDGAVMGTSSDAPYPPGKIDTADVPPRSSRSILANPRLAGGVDTAFDIACVNAQKGVAAVIASSSFANLPAGNAFSGTANEWATNATSTGHVGAQLKTATVLTSYKVQGRQGAAAAQTPKDWKFQGSNDSTNGSDGTWVDLDTRTGQNPTTLTTYTFTNATAYLYYRLNFTTVQSGTYGGLRHLVLPDLGTKTVHSGTSGEVWAVIKGASGGERSGWGRTGTGPTPFYPYSDGTVYYEFGSSSRPQFTPTTSVTAWHIVRYVKKSDGTMQAYINGVLQHSANTGAAAWAATILLGKGDTTASPSAARFAEVIHFSAELSSGDATKVSNYLTDTHISAVSAGTPTGSAVGAFSWSGFATGARSPKGAAAGAFTWSGSAAGKRSAKGSAAGAFAWAGSASGAAPVLGSAEGSAAGTFGWVGSAAGKTSRSGSAAGAFAWAGSAVGTSGPPPTAGAWRDRSTAAERWVSAPVIAPPSERTRWVEAAVCGESMEFAPRAVATPPALEVAPVKRLGMKMPAMSASYRHPVPFEGGFDIERADVGRLQTIIGGRNFTFARNIPTTLDRFASEGPMCDTQATVRLPLDPWDEIGADDLAAIREDAQVDVILVRPDGSVEYKWEGFVSAHDDNTDESGEDYTVQCEGMFMQAAHWPWDVPVVSELRDVGHVVADALNSVPNRRWRKIPRVATGILTSERGQQGWSTWQFVQTVLGKAWTSDGRQWSLERVARRTYRIVLKASTTAPTFTITKGAPGVGVSLRRDFSTRRDAIFARGYAPDGGYWCGRVFPSLDFGVPPRYPFNNASLNITVGTRDRDTDTGNGVTLWQRRMRELGYPVTVDGVMNSADTKWVYRIQRDRGLTVDGSLGPQTWNATFEDNSHDADLTTYRVPLAFNADAWPWRYTASGARTLKTDRDTSVILHAMPEVDWGTDIRKTSAIEPTKRMLEREGVPGWTGTVTLRSDPWEAGSSRLDIREGHNLLILGHYGGTVVQVASADHQDDASVFTVDTKARDAMSLDAIRDRDREARRDAAGRGKTSDRSALNNAQVVQYESESKAGFVSRTAVNGNSGLWSVRKAFVSQVGVAKVEFDALSPKAEIVAAIFNRPIRTSVLATLAPDPLADDDKWYENEQILREKYGLMEIFGTTGNPGGYYPRQKGKGPLTGKLRDGAGLPYDSPYGGFVWVALFTSRSTWVEGRIFPAVPQ